MNILVITPIYYIKDRKNLFHDSSAIHYLIRPWAKEHNVTVINIYSQPIGKIIRYKSREERNYYRKGYHFFADGVKVHMCEIQRFYKQKAILDDRQTKRVLDFIDSVISEENKPDVIVAHMPTFCLNVLERIYPSVKKMAVLHQTDVINCREDISKVEKINLLFSKIFTRSNAIRKFCRKQSIRAEEEIVYSGVPINIKEQGRKEKPDKYRIIYVGKLIKRKNVDKCILCLQDLSLKVSFDIYGSGPELPYLQKLAQESRCSANITFHGQVAHEKIADIMENGDIFIMTSVGETFGLVYLEAMAFGNIVIGSRNEGIDGVIVDGENGFLVEPYNIEELVNCLESIFRMDKEKYAEITQNANLTAKKYTEEKMGRKYLSMIRSCIK